MRIRWQSGLNNHHYLITGQPILNPVYSLPLNNAVSPDKVGMSVEGKIINLPLKVRGKIDHNGITVKGAI